VDWFSSYLSSSIVIMLLFRRRHWYW